MPSSAPICPMPVDARSLSSLLALMRETASAGSADIAIVPPVERPVRRDVCVGPMPIERDRAKPGSKVDRRKNAVGLEIDDGHVSGDEASRQKQPPLRINGERAYTEWTAERAQLLESIGIEAQNLRSDRCCDQKLVC